MAEPGPSIRLPEAKDVEIVLVRLADGTIVARARHEVTPKPAPKEAAP